MIKRLLMLALLPFAAQAGDDFARQWPLQLPQADAGAYRVPLDASVYAAAYWRDLRDVQVLDADGMPVASVVQAAAVPLSAPLRTRDLPWFALPAAMAAGNDDLSVVVRRDAGGRLLSLSGTVAGTAAAGANTPAWLLDLGDDAGTLRALRVDWRDADAAVDLGYRLEGSDDLRTWRVLDPQVRLLQLRNQGHELHNARIPLAAPPRYLRLVPLQAQGAPALAGIRGEFADAVEAGDWHWQALQAAGGGDAQRGYLYALPGRFPVQRVDVDMPANSAVTWTLSSRDQDSVAAAEGEPAWQLLASGWNAWNLSGAGAQQRSAPLETSGVVEDRQWRLQVEPGALPAAAPVLRLGYRPGSVVFLAQGRAPYVLVAGSANAGAAQAALEPMLAALRARNGAQWQPAAARLGTGSVRGGDAAYRPATPPRDWKNIVLWAVLVLGALAVAGFAFSLVRGQKTM